MDKELLEAIGQMLDTKLDQKLQPIVERLDRLEDKVDELKEAHEETREAVNKVAEWADNAGFLLKIPFGQVK